MQTLKNTALILSIALWLSGCLPNSSDNADNNANNNSSNNTNNNSADANNITITALSGLNYLSQASIYPFTDEGICAIEDTTQAQVTALGMTDDAGQFTTPFTTIAMGYCAVTDTGLTLFAPRPIYLEQETQSTISPLSSYLYTYLNANTDTEILVLLEQAQDQLLSALSINSNAQTRQLLSTDLLSASATDNNTPENVAQLQVLSELLYRTQNAQSTLSPPQTLNFAQVASTPIRDLASEPLDPESQQLNQLVTYLNNRLTELASDDPLLLETFTNEINDPVLLAQMPLALTEASGSSATLATQLMRLIEAQVATNADPSINLALSNLELTGITDPNNNADIQYALTMQKQGAQWPASVLFDSREPTTGSFSNGNLQLTNLIFNQQGTFLFELIAQNTIEGETFNSLPLSFSQTITESQLSNLAPEFIGMDETASTELLSFLNNEAQQADVFTDEFIIPGVIELPAEFQLNARNFESGFDQQLNALFTDPNDALNDDPSAEISYRLEMETDDQGFFFLDLGGNYLFTTGAIAIPSLETGNVVYQYSLFAQDNLGARADQGFNFQLTVTPDKTASIQAINGSVTDDDSEQDNNAPFLAVMLNDNQLTAIENTLLAKLGVEVEGNNNLFVEQIFEVREYTCDQQGACERGATVNELPQATLSTNPYLTLEADGSFAATGTPVTSPETLSLTATYQGEPIKIYAVDEELNLLTNDLAVFGNGLTININSATEVSVDVAD